MQQIRFYQLTTGAVEKGLPKLMEKFYEQKQRVILLCQTESEAKSLNACLWTYHPSSFLPHGAPEDGNPEDQPIWVSTKIEPLNEATTCVSTFPCSLEELSSFKTVVYFFKERVEEFLSLYEKTRQEKEDVVFWEQTLKEGWVRKKVDSFVK